MRRALFVSSLALLGGCFVYAPAETRNTPAGKQIEITVNAAGARALDDELGSNVRLVSGTLYGDDADAIQVRVRRVLRADGKALPSDGVMLRIPHDYVIAVHERRVSERRTWAASLTAIAAFALMNRSR